MPNARLIPPLASHGRAGVDPLGPLNRSAGRQGERAAYSRLVGASTQLLKTYRFLRLGMVVLALMLLTSVAIEIIQAGGCVRTSISSYYFTPARGVFVGALVAIGACLIVLKGNTEIEDVLLNIAGLLSAVVAFVPIADPGECSSAVVALTDSRPNVFNNVTALAVSGLVALVVVIVLARRESGGPPPLRHVLGFGSVLLFGGGLLAAFLWAREAFDRWAHYAAAIPMFVLLVAVMVINAVSFGRTDAAEEARRPTGKDVVNRYAGIAAVTLVAVVALLAARFVLGWAHGLFWAEVAVVVAFGVFWVVQTVELWQADEGLRPDPQGVRGDEGVVDTQ